MTINIKDISEKDLNSVLHPFTQLKDFASGKLGDPTIVETGKGIRIQDAHGNEFIDGFAGLYCVNVGYGRTEVAEAISRQAYRLAYYHSYAAHTTDELAILSDRLVQMAPGKMSKVFYGMSGSDANETQAKLVWYYNNLRGKPTKKKIISRERGYHGCSVVSGSMTGMSFYHDHMDLPLPQIEHTGVPHHYWGANPGETEREFSARRAEELNQLIQRLGPDNVGAFIAEPVLGTGGITPPPEGYWEAIQPVLKKHDVLMIADEVITGFGRTGSMFGSQHYGIEPDLITIAKGLTSAYFPLSASIVGERVYKVLEDGADKVGAFSHGYTYSGHPIGAAAANAVLDIVEKEDLPGNAREVGARVSKAARERGLIARAMPHGDILGFAPPLVTTKGEVDEIVAIAEKAVHCVIDDLVLEGQKI
ncbi:MAG: aminotransferase class III-fold pyridoxal phosphate-dependent enzyme [Mesorhizobium sp.]|uniref:aminotransferase class III-fold pyridoxal phosphate-dependent enzyme n=1 Tax=Mesorhizobium sp. TaxID=1871066 RepID=UPI000FE929E5|nr:aminotransferase class III-fold pyridoxal phosphate-dependent enzyme [Mesorhizobium sp.]RWL89268.1 MAG: aminotransferase class III-fold pyridoxal phosphate-dependent enzyme [Mesorhizobium sp.]TIP39715.1 MAG: aminotransferase class III-fold pyridoxal phosphate-dependent enzyme [Mesorhizobium sp.]TJV68002.1 MAG: aminotransferase class III-fold pyridoxal phosphate-dependent enzyme [Mesorhizobium sp.]